MTPTEPTEVVVTERIKKWLGGMHGTRVLSPKTIDVYTRATQIKIQIKIY